MKSSVNYALIGSGAIANLHAEALKGTERGRLIGVYSQDFKQAAEFAVKHKLRVYKTSEEMYSDKFLDAVSICTPSGMHAAQAAEALSNGLNVVVEKPLALNLKDCEAVEAAEKKSGKVCAVISQLRYSQTMRSVRRAVEDGCFGRLVNGSVYMKYYRAPEYYSQSPWKGTLAMDGGGALMNQGIHGIDLLLYFMGDAVSVYGCAKTLVHGIETEDTAAAVLEFKNGAVGVIEGATSVYPGYPRRFEICGDKGSATLEETLIKRWDLSCPIPDSSHEGYFAHNNPMDLSHEGHRLQFEEFNAAVLSGGKVLYGPAQAKKTVALICAIYQSAKTGKKIDL